MRNLLTAAILWLALAPAAFAQQDQAAGGREASALATAFAHAFVSRDPAAAVGVMHPALSKLGVWANFRGSGRDGILSLPPGALDILSESHNRDDHLTLETTPIRVDVLDSTEGVGVVRLVVGEDWYDYYLAARSSEGWRIINGVFGSVRDVDQPVAEDERDAVLHVARSYAQAMAAGDVSRALAWTHLDFSSRSVSHRRHRLLVVEGRDSLGFLAARPSVRTASEAQVIALAGTTAAVRIDTSAYTEWVFLLRLDGEWRLVSSFWSRR